MFKASIDIVSYNSINLIANVSAVLADLRIPVTEISSHELKNGNSDLIVTCTIGGVKQLNNAISRIRKIQDVISAERATGSL